MMDLNEEKRSEADNTKASSPSASPNKHIKSCSDCHTTRTPLWRGGPAGPKSLCNACGIKYNKKRRELLGLDRGRNEKGKKKRKSGGGGGSNSNGTKSKKEGLGESLKMKLMALGGEMMLRRSGKQLGNRKLREEEQAAILLMALSCGSVYYAQKS